MNKVFRIKRYRYNIILQKWVELYPKNRLMFDDEKLMKNKVKSLKRYCDLRNREGIIMAYSLEEFVNGIWENKDCYPENNEVFEGLKIEQ